MGRRSKKISIKNKEFKHSVNEYLTHKDIYNNYWRCRDFELTTLWQRSVFLSAFLILGMSGYAFFLFSYKSNILVSFGSNTFNIIGMIISSLNLLLAYMWTLMARGSKRWYEKYETYISIYENDVAKGYFKEHNLKYNAKHERANRFNPAWISSFQNKKFKNNQKRTNSQFPKKDILNLLALASYSDIYKRYLEHNCIKSLIIITLVLVGIIVSAIVFFYNYLILIPIAAITLSIIIFCCSWRTTILILPSKILAIIVYILYSLFKALYCTDKGYYSPSRINILLGSILFIVWGGVLFSHIIAQLNKGLFSKICDPSVISSIIIAGTILLLSLITYQGRSRD